MPNLFAFGVKNGKTISFQYNFYLKRFFQSHMYFYRVVIPRTMFYRKLRMIHIDNINSFRWENNPVLLMIFIVNKNRFLEFSIVSVFF